MKPVLPLFPGSRTLFSRRSRACHTAQLTSSTSARLTAVKHQSTVRNPAGIRERQRASGRYSSTKPVLPLFPSSRTLFHRRSRACLTAQLTSSTSARPTAVKHQSTVRFCLVAHLILALSVQCLKFFSFFLDPPRRDCYYETKSKKPKRRSQ